jgi:hypothetical protein
VTAEPAALDPAFLDDVRRAMRAEIGARAFYGALARSSRDRELASLLAGFHEEELEQIERLRALLGELGHRAAIRGRRRAASARLLALATRFGARRIALRLCHESESTVARWYLGFAAYLARAGRFDHARTCEALSLTKRRHALALEAWVPR